MKTKTKMTMTRFKKMKSKQDNSLSRRNFVKSSTLATTGILSAGLPVGAMANVYGNKKLMLSDALSYRFMPEGKNRGVFLQNTMGFKDIQDVVLREDS